MVSVDQDIPVTQLDGRSVAAETRLAPAVVDSRERRPRSEARGAFDSNGRATAGRDIQAPAIDRSSEPPRQGVNSDRGA